MPAQLLALNEGASILVDKPILLLGRHPECDIQIESRKISRRHCCIAQVNDYLVVRDLDSTNGIRINGVRVVEGRLHEGDELTIGGSRYRVGLEEADAAVIPARPVPATAPRGRAAPVPLHLDDDDDLEDCDEPVPLVETRRQVRTPHPPVPPPAASATPTRKALEEESSSVLPSDLDLLPGSGQHPNGTK